MSQAGGTSPERGQHVSAARGEVLSEYRRRKLDLAEVIRMAMDLAEQRHDSERTAGARELLARLAEDRFQLAVVGQFSRGKSTLINAILGRSYLPTGALPMTSVVTTVGYGSRPRATVRRTEAAFPIETSIDDLERFVAQASAEREELGVASVEIQVPAEVLRLGFSFVDTPGVGSAIAANTATARRFLPEADAVIFVTSFDAPLGEPEVEFLNEVRRRIKRLFLVVNKLDLVSAAEAEEVMRFVRDRVLDQIGGESRTFALSARGALEAKLHGDAERLTASGLPQLEQTLVRFLTTEKSRSFLLRMCDRAERLLAHQQLDVELGRLARSDAGHAARVRRFEDRGQDLIEAWLRRQLPAVRSLLVGIAEEHIARLAALKGSVQPAAAEAFGLPFPQPQQEPTEWSSAALPQLAVGRLPLAIPLQLPWRLFVMPGSRLEQEGYRLRNRDLVRPWRQSNDRHLSASLLTHPPRSASQSADSG